jgi:hypothetical protein
MAPRARRRDRRARSTILNASAEVIYWKASRIVDRTTIDLTPGKESLSLAGWAGLAGHDSELVMNCQVISASPHLQVP